MLTQSVRPASVGSPSVAMNNVVLAGSTILVAAAAITSFWAMIRPILGLLINFLVVYS